LCGRGRKRDATPRAFEQVCAYRLFEPLNAFGQCRLGPPEPFGSPTHVSEISYHLEISQVTEIHLFLTVIDR
jgi:hypothetical protein